MEPEKFTFFWSGTFSQRHPSPFMIDAIWYNCAEQYMMAAKARLFRDQETERKIMSSVEPIDQKRYGQKVRNFIQDTWYREARSIVFRGNQAKFLQNEDMKKELLATVGTTLVEASPSDELWGIGLRKTNPLAQNRETWKGKNWLGQTLTELREYLIKEGH